jgi:hypothetical protein
MERKINRICTDDQELRELVIGTVSDMVIDFLYYDRKDDDELSYDDVAHAFESGVVTVEEVVAEFDRRLREDLRLGVWQ